MTLHNETSSRKRRPSLGRVLSVLALILPIAACAKVDRMATGTTIPDDYHARHPIVLANTARTLDIFVVSDSGKLDQRQKADLEAFARLYRMRGRGQMSAMVPSNIMPSAREATLNTIRSSLAANGIKGYLLVSTFPVTDDGLASPIRLSYQQLAAKVATRCGEWPADLASGSSAVGWENRPYYNLGCSTQQALASQVDDPLDLVRPRDMELADVQMRTRAIGFIRQGTDPGTIWTTTTTNIGNLGN